MKKFISVLLMCFLLSMALLPMLHAADAVSADQFNDLKNLPKEEKDKFDSLIREGVFSGLSDDTFGLDSPMNRAQFAKVAAIIFKLPVDQTLAKSSFTDIASGHWALPYVEALKKAGLTNGYDAEGKTYNPDGTVTRQELAAFLVRGLGLDEAAKQATPVTDSTVDDWAKGNVALVLEKKIMTNLDDGTFGGKTPATRKMLALASYAAKQLVAAVAETGTPQASPAPTAPGATPAPEPTPGTSSAPQTGEVSLKGKKAIVISDYQSGKSELREDEEPLINRLKALGFTVSRLASTKIGSESFDGYDLVVIGASTNNKYVMQNAQKVHNLPIPVLYNKGGAFGYAGFSKVAENTDAEKQTTITITNSEHPMAAGLKGDVVVFYDPNKIDYAVPGGDAIVVAYLQGADENFATVIGYEKGTKDVNGATVAARVALFCPEAGADLPQYATDELWKIFDATVTWLMQNPQ